MCVCACVRKEGGGGRKGLCFTVARELMGIKIKYCASD